MEKNTNDYVSSFRQRSRYSNHKPKPRARGTSGLYGSAFRVSDTNQDPDEILLVPGKYATQFVDDNGDVAEIVSEYYSYRQHYDNRHNRYIICSAGPNFRDVDAAEPCMACLVNRELTEWGDGPRPVKNSYVSYARNMNAFTIIHFHRYHLVPQVRKGRVSKNPKGNPYMEWVRCEGRNCDRCKGDYKTVEARRLHWSLGPTHYNSLLQHNDRIGANCANCGATRSINWEAWVCAGCGAPFIENDVTNMSNDEIEEFVNAPRACPECGIVEFPKEAVYCEECGSDARRMTIFDTRLFVDKEVPGGDSKQTVVHFENAPTPELTKEEAALVEPFDLAEVFKPDTLEEQARIVDWDIPEGWRSNPSGRTPVRR